ncbi:MAG: alpha/beta hydrolase, partial [Leptospiraceae bacterium]|nr:alpha/beta hydrolase [Leptospiraceae bacterium]
MDIIQKHKIKIIEPENPKGTIMFGNGFGTDQTYWNNITPKFEKDYKIVHYENIGANNAGTEFYSPNKYDNLNTYSRDLINICKHLDLKDIIFVTHSVSGMIGLLASNMDESLFSKIIFIGASPRYLNDDGYTGGFNSPDLENLFETMRANYFAWASGFGPIAMNTPGKPELSDYFVKTLSAIRPDIAISVAKTIFYSDHREDLPK